MQTTEPEPTEPSQTDRARESGNGTGAGTG